MGIDDHEQQPSQTLSRKEFVKSVATVAAGAAVGYGVSSIIGGEIDKAREGIKTSVGTFIPLYERHDIGIKPEAIPDDIAVLFREVIGRNGEYMTWNKMDILRSEGTGLDTYPHSHSRVFPDAILSRLSIIGAEVMIGDVDTPLVIDRDLTAGEGSLAGELAFIPAFVPWYYKKIGRKELTISRRKSVKAFSVGALAWSVSPLLLAQLNELGEAHYGTVQRIVARLVAMDSHLHPELLNVFFRNLMMSDKLLTVASVYCSKMGRVPKIAFQVEGGHSGIEDLLQAGPEVCRALVLAYPDFVLRQLVDRNGGVEDFCSARLFKLPPDLRPQDIANNEILGKTSERVVTDEKLKRALIQRLGK